MSKQLGNLQWKEFMMSDIFEIKNGYYNKKPPFIKDGSIPFLGASLFNNAITGFLNVETINTYNQNGERDDRDVDRRLFEGNCLAVVNNGTAVGDAYYQLNSFTCSHDVTPVYLKKHVLNEYIALFLIPLIAKSGEPFKYANKWRPIRMRRTKIILPVKYNKPDWEFMEQFMRDVEVKITPKIEFEKHDICDERDINDLKWDEFVVEDIAEIMGGRDIYARERVVGKTPYITSTALMNGVGYFVDNKNDSLEKNCISINRNGSVGFSFFHDYYALYGNDVRKVRLKNGYNENRYISLFITTVLMEQKEKYSYSVKMGTKRLKRQKIMLPINGKYKPDWDFMEQYMKRIENELMSAVDL